MTALAVGLPSNARLTFYFWQCVLPEPVIITMKASFVGALVMTCHQQHPL
jgi:uncharacterized integral membrane protein